MTLRGAPEEMRGRIVNTVLMVATGLAALAPLVAGLLVQHVSGSWAVGAFALTMAAAAGLCLALPGLRNAEFAAKLAAACYSYTLAQKQALALANLASDVSSIIGALPI